MVKQLFQVMVCDATAKKSSASPVSYGTGGGYYCNQGSGKFCNSPLIPLPVCTSGKEGKCTSSFGPDGACGKMITCNPRAVCSGEGADSLACVACQAQATVLPQVLGTLSNAAAVFTEVDYQYRDFYAHSSNLERKPEWSWIFSYCTANGILPENCCIGSNANAFMPGITKCKTLPGSDNFPSPNGGSATSGGADPQGPSTRAVTTLYLPYGMPAVDPKTNSNFLRTTSGEYIRVIQTAVTDWVTSKKNSVVNDDLKEAIDKGWIFAGSYYYTIAGMNNKAQGESMPLFDVQVSSMLAGLMADYRNNTRAALALVSEIGNNASDSEDSSSKSKKNKMFRANLPSEVSDLNDPMNDSFASLNDANQEAINPAGDEDPISKLISAGNGLIWTATVLFGILTGITITLGLLGYLSPFVLGTGVTNPVGGAIGLFYMLFIPAFYALCGFMITTGAALAIYVPLIPYIIFTMGAIGWMLSVVETMVASPLVALGIISPSGQHEIMGKAEPAIMLLFNVFLRPMLMVFGLIAGMLLAKVVVTMINAAFWSTVRAGVQPNGLIQIILYLLAYMSVTIAALNKCFAAIYIIPQQVMTWVSAQGAQYGEAEALGEVKGKTEQAAGAVGGVAGGAESGMGGASKQKGEGDIAREQMRGSASQQDKLGGR
jgi:hypothetical protein